jgi:TRAP-type C4-dicarboxylate transport system substrate-binding protein
MRRLMLALCLLLSVASASAQEKFRMAVLPPEGTSYAHELRAFAHEVAQLTGNALRVHFYMGGIAGDELQVGERIERGQLDGTASAGMLCQKVMPSFRAMRVLGLFLSRAEVDHVLGRVGPRLSAEAARAGYAYLGGASLGRTVILSRVPLRSYEDLRRVKLWRWSLDDVPLQMGKVMGLNQVALPLDDAARAYEEKNIDGYYTIPVAALAWGLQAYTGYVLDMSVDFLSGCMLVSQKSFNRLSREHQQALRTAAAKLAVRFGSIGQLEDDRLLGGVLAKHGTVTSQMSPAMRTTYLAQARAARDRLGATLVPEDALREIQSALADYRVAHPSK